MYILDTDTCSYLMKRTHPSLVEKVRAFAPQELKVSVVTVFELEYGARRSLRHDEIQRVIRAFLDNLEVLPFGIDAARRAGAIRADLATRGVLIGAYDLLIAGHACSSGGVLVTNNDREFSRVEGLAIENWT